MSMDQTLVNMVIYMLQRGCSPTSSEGGDLALLIEGVGKALRSSQNLLVCWLEGLLEELEGTHMGRSHPSCEPYPTNWVRLSKIVQYAQSMHCNYF